MIAVGSSQDQPKFPDVWGAGQRFIHAILNQASNNILLVMMNHRDDRRRDGRGFQPCPYFLQHFMAPFKCIQEDCIDTVVLPQHASEGVRFALEDFMAGSQHSHQNVCEALVRAAEPESDNLFFHLVLPPAKDWYYDAVNIGASRNADGFSG